MSGSGFGSSQRDRNIPGKSASRGFESTSSAFDQMSLNESSRSSRSTDPKVFRDGRAARPSDVFIALMGVTGSGKSSFISLCCQRVAEVGHELRACTTVVDVYAYELSASRTIYLIDTPGFDDTSRSDTEVLREIAGWLTASYSNRVLLHGILYLHRIADVRMQGSAKKNLLMFKKLCGDDALRKVVLTTTMWDKVPQREAEDREQQLIKTPEFWGFMVSKGSITYRHNNTVESAARIIEELARDNSTMTLDLQNQMVNQNQTLVETAAGKELESELIKERQKWASELKETQEQIREAIRLRDKESEQALQELKNDYTTRMARMERDNKKLHVDAERLHIERTERLEKALESQREGNANILKKLQQRDVPLEGASKKELPVHKPASKPLRYKTLDLLVEFSASLNGSYWTLFGPKYYTGSWAFMSKFPRPGFCDFYVMGTKGSGIYKYNAGDGGSEIDFKYNFHVEYPRLYKILHDWSHAEVWWICLGPGGTYFAKWKNTCDYHLPPAIESQIIAVEGHGEITTVALGIDETYVIVHGKECKWSLKGHYGKLATYLKNATLSPKLVALDLQGNEDFLILLDTLKNNLSSPRKNQDCNELKWWNDKHNIK